MFLSVTMAFSLAGKFLNFYLEWNENKTMHYYSKKRSLSYRKNQSYRLSPSASLINRINSARCLSRTNHSISLRKYSSLFLVASAR